MICDDEPDIVSALKIYLTGDEYQLFEAYNGRQALETVDNNEIHLVLLDIMMPEMDGIQTLSRIREHHNMPVIFLTAKGEDTDKILGLNIGADHYVTKPFNPVELLARVKSQLRRYLELGSAPMRKSVFQIGDIELDDTAKEVRLMGEKVGSDTEGVRNPEVLPGASGTGVFSGGDLSRSLGKKRRMVLREL